MSSTEPAAASPAKRNRIQLSCTHCRHAKLKCDREKPCAQCIKRGRSGQCTFPPAVARKRPAVSMHNRLEHLEGLVKGAMAGQAPLAAPDATTGEDTPDAFNRMVLEPVNGSYVGATHWAAMLDDIEEVKGYLGEVDEQDNISLLSHAASDVSRESLLAKLPERSTVNRLVSLYFNSKSPGLHIVHKPTFERHYRTFWADPLSFPISFLGLLYSLMCIGASALQQTAGEDSEEAAVRSYRESCIQCLSLSNYAAYPGPHTLETLITHMEGEYVLNTGDPKTCYVIIGVAVPLALRMGLHRDPAHAGNALTAFQGEMRRRIWHMLVQMEILFSFHNGLPSLVQAVSSDTRAPSNLHDHDFGEGTTQLPASRPESESTVMSYTLAKGRLARVFGKIIEQANRLALPSYQEVMALDRELGQAHAAVPPFLRLVPLDSCITDSAELVLRRLSLAALLQVARCILHRKHCTGDNDERFEYSRATAVEASLELLRVQSDVHEAVQPGGLLCRDAWIISSLAAHDLLLAAMIIYMCLVRQERSSPAEADMVAALETSCRIWSQTRSVSVHAGKAYAVLCKMLGRLGTGAQPDATRGSNSEAIETDTLNIIGDTTDDLLDFDWIAFDGHVRRQPVEDLSIWPGMLHHPAEDDY